MKSKIGDDIEYAKQILENGGLVAIPTETVYGLAANALDEDAVLKIFKAKNRPFFDPLIVHTSDFSRVHEYLLSPIPHIAFSLEKEYWPGPLSLILDKKANGFSDLITAGFKTVAIRVPRHPLTMQLLENLPFPIVAPSANPFGYVSPTQAIHVQDQLGEQVDYILDGGSTEVGLESTILDLTTEPPLLRRRGGISIEKIHSIIPDLQVADVSSSNPKSPGMLKSHYATKTKISFSSVNDLLSQYDKSEVGGLFFCKRTIELPQDQQLVLSVNCNVDEAARNLFSFMRILDKKGFKVIASEWVPDEGLGRAINDKLRRASA